MQIDYIFWPPAMDRIVTFSNSYVEALTLSMTISEESVFRRYLRLNEVIMIGLYSDKTDFVALCEKDLSLLSPLSLFLYCVKTW